MLISDWSSDVCSSDLGSFDHLELLLPVRMHGVGRGLALPEQVLRAVAAAAVAERKAAAAALAERIVGVFAMSRGNDEAIPVVGDGEVPVHLPPLPRGQAGLLQDRMALHPIDVEIGSTSGRERGWPE